MILYTNYFNSGAGMLETKESYLQAKVFELEAKVNILEKDILNQKSINKELSGMIKDLTRYDLKETDILNILKHKIEDNRKEVIDLTHTINNITKVIKSLESRC